MEYIEDGHPHMEYIEDGYPHMEYIEDGYPHMKYVEDHISNFTIPLIHAKSLREIYYNLQNYIISSFAIG